MRVSAEEAKGPTYGRYLGSKLIGGDSEFCMQTDAHMDVCACVRCWARLGSAGNCLFWAMASSDFCFILFNTGWSEHHTNQIKRTHTD